MYQSAVVPSSVDRKYLAGSTRSRNSREPSSSTVPVATTSPRLSGPMLTVTSVPGSASTMASCSTPGRTSRSISGGTVLVAVSAGGSVTGGAVVPSTMVPVEPAAVVSAAVSPSSPSLEHDVIPASREGGHDQERCAANQRTMRAASHAVDLAMPPAVPPSSAVLVNELRRSAQFVHENRAANRARRTDRAANTVTACSASPTCPSSRPRRCSTICARWSRSSRRRSISTRSPRRPRR